MGGYRDFLRNALELLRSAHPVFGELEWVGDGKRKAVRIATDLSNLDDLVYRYSWGQKKHVRGKRNTDGTSNWESENVSGYSMWFNTRKSSRAGGLTLSVHAGDAGHYVPNSIVLRYPGPENSEFPHRDLYEYDTVRKLMLKLMHFSVPKRAIATLYNFSKAIDYDGPLEVGYLTYFADNRCESLTGQFLTEKTDLPGTLFTLGPDCLFVNSEQTISAGLRLRKALKQVGVLK